MFGPIESSSTPMPPLVQQANNTNLVVFKWDRAWVLLTYPAAKAVMKKHSEYFNLRFADIAALININTQEQINLHGTHVLWNDSEGICKVRPLQRMINAFNKIVPHNIFLSLNNEENLFDKVFKEIFIAHHDKLQYFNLVGAFDSRSVNLGSLRERSSCSSALEHHFVFFNQINNVSLSYIENLEDLTNQQLAAPPPLNVIRSQPQPLPQIMTASQIADDLRALQKQKPQDSNLASIDPSKISSDGLDRYNAIAPVIIVGQPSLNKSHIKRLTLAILYESMDTGIEESGIEGLTSEVENISLGTNSDQVKSSMEEEEGESINTNSNQVESLMGEEEEEFVNTNSG